MSDVQFEPDEHLSWWLYATEGVEIIFEPDPDLPPAYPETEEPA